MLSDTQIEILKGYLEKPTRVLTIEYPCDIHGSLKIVSVCYQYRFVDIIDIEGRTQVLSSEEYRGHQAKHAK
jgi:hypothetical protein